jgi:tRNA nucleotidyltransferase (CCA-adding enzyme)
LLAALTHDLGKPATTLRQGGRVRSPGHAERDDLMESFLRRIGTPERLRRRVIVLGRFHLTHLGFADSKRHVRRLARALGEAGETIPMLARLVEADGSGRSPLPGGMPDEMARLLEVAHEVAADEAAPPRILLGRHLIAEGVEPGPEMGQMLDEAYEAQLDGAFDDLEGALRWWRERHG